MNSDQTPEHRSQAASGAFDGAVAGALRFLFEDADKRPDFAEIVRRGAALEDLLAPAFPSVKQQWARKGFHRFSQIVSSDIRKAALKPLRRLRDKEAVPLKSAGECTFNAFVRQLDEAGWRRRGYRGKRAALCLSYDIDHAICHDTLRPVTDELRRRGLTATYNILTDWEYAVDWDRVESVRADGIEIGLHGATHDIGLGYRSARAIGDELDRAIAATPFKLAGYRAPALCMSPRLMAAVAERGFAYDSSLPMTNRYYKAVESCFPYPVLPGNGRPPLWEMPVVIQDSTLVLDLHLDEDAMVEAFRREVGAIIDLGGVAIVNLHPYVSVPRPRFHAAVLDWVAGLNDVWVTTQAELMSEIERAVAA